LSGQSIYYALARNSFPAELKAGFKDIWNSFKSYRIWVAVGLNDVAARYRGSLLGPFWITITTAVFVLGIGFLYAGLMRVPPDRYLPWMTLGIVVWGLINQTVLEGADAFIAAGNMLRQTAIPVPLFIWRVVWRNILTFLHQAPVIIAVALWFGFFLRMNVPEALIGLVLILVNVSWFALCAAIVSARFRDLQQVLAAVMQVVFFLSPVLWIPSETRGASGLFVSLNPIAQMLNVVRDPLLGQGLSRYGVLYLLALAIVGWTVALLFFSRIRRRIVHYL
jgi:ABC-type polysaccharide/polyol phosphate export permease